MDQYHESARSDTSKLDIHHTLGSGTNQAAPGDQWQSVLKGVTFTGSRASNANIIPQLIAALVKLGAVDSSTP